MHALIFLSQFPPLITGQQGGCLKKIISSPFCTEGLSPIQCYAAIGGRMERRNKSKLTCCDLRREEASKRGVFQLRQHGSGYHNEEGADPTANCVGEREFQPIQKKIGRERDGAKWREAEKPLWSFVRQRSNSPTTWQPNRASAAQAATPKVNSIGCNPIINRARVRPAPYFTHRSHTIPSSVRNINSLIGKGRDAKENILCTHLLLFGLVAVDQRVCVRECMSWVEICLVTTANQFSYASFLPI